MKNYREKMYWEKPVKSVRIRVTKHICHTVRKSHPPEEKMETEGRVRRLGD